MKKITEEYLEFVDSVTSDASKNYGTFETRIKELSYKGVDVPRLLTGTIGLNSEAGEFGDIAKKIYFQGKEYSEENRDKLIKELGDVMWYVAVCCMSLDVSLEEVLQRNIGKLTNRYPDGFDKNISENKKE